MTLSHIDEAGRQFLARLHEQTKGDLSRQVSMYAVGESLGWDRETAAAVAQTLIAAELVHIMTLSGGIGISAEGVEAVKPAAAPDGSGRGVVRLGRDRVMPEAERLAADRVCAGLKLHAGGLGLDFEELAELVADIKTLSAQLESSRPKTAIVRECLRSLGDSLKGKPDSRELGEITALLGD